MTSKLSLLSLAASSSPSSPTASSLDIGDGRGVGKRSLMDALRRLLRSPDGEFSLIASVIETSLNFTNAFGCLSRLSGTSRKS